VDARQLQPANFSAAHFLAHVGSSLITCTAALSPACRCTSGCSCEPKPRVDALHGLRQSTIYLVRLLVSQAQRCEISVTLLQDSSSGQHKFKVGCRVGFERAQQEISIEGMCIVRCPEGVH
jgi:hypothetical protein